MLPLYGSLVTVTFAPDWVNTPLQSLLTCWPPGNVQLAVQLLVAPLPALLMTHLGLEAAGPGVHHRVRARQRAAGGGLLGGGVPLPAPGSGNWIPASSDCFSALTGVGS